MVNLKHRIAGVLLICFTILINSNGQAIANLKVYANDRVAISSDLFGINNDWRQISNTAFPDFVTSFESINYGVFRFPGGWESEFYSWSSNSTPGWDKTPSEPGASVTSLKAEVQNYSIVVPTVTAMEKTYGSAQWDAAINNLKLVAKDAITRADPDKVKYVEIGNEWWLQAAGGSSRANKLLKYSKIAMEITGYIHAQFPTRSFKIFVNGDYTVPEEFTAMKTHFSEIVSYNAVDGVALHTYTGYTTDTHNISELGERIEACAKNFNSQKDMLVYLSEWMPSRDYNERRLYMEAANIIPDIIHIYAREGVDAAAYWPPVNNSVPGLGIVNWNGSVVFPCGQILGEMAASFKGDVVRTVSDRITITGALQDPNNLVLFVMGKDFEKTDVIVTVSGFSIDHIKSVKKLRSEDYFSTDKAAPYKTEAGSATLLSSNEISFEINKNGQYEIFKIELSGSPLEETSINLIDFESPVSVTEDYGAIFNIVDNPDNRSLNGTSTCGQIGRTSSNWYELVDIETSFSIPAGDTRYLHMMVLYDKQPDFILRLNQAGNEGNIRPLNTYTDLGKWQDLVFELNGGTNGIDVNNLRLMGDCGFENDPAGFVLEASTFGWIDEIFLNENSIPRSYDTAVGKGIKDQDYEVYSSNGKIYVEILYGLHTQINVYNNMGVLVESAEDAHLEFEVPAAGLYIVQIGNHTEKLIVF
ncbi:hypothetical protein [Saccharicrinis sp. GN24d3]|uniref:hypothetical protein n=1 Tax=Saccharicrinis sp. GN24d3 TaxID=3458416 RepID=UPI00403608CB